MLDFSLLWTIVDDKIKRDREKHKRHGNRKRQARTRPRRGGGTTSDNDTERDGDDADSNLDGDSGSVSVQPNSSLFSSARGSLADSRSGATIQGDNSSTSTYHPSNPSRQDKWYSLYSVIIREGDGSNTNSSGSVIGNGSQTTYTLLLRPEEVRERERNL